MLEDKTDAAYVSPFRPFRSLFEINTSDNYKKSTSKLERYFGISKGRQDLFKRQTQMVEKTGSLLGRDITQSELHNLYEQSHVDIPQSCNEDSKVDVDVVLDHDQLVFPLIEGAIFSETGASLFIKLNSTLDGLVFIDPESDIIESNLEFSNVVSLQLVKSLDESWELVFDTKDATKFVIKSENERQVLIWMIALRSQLVYCGVLKLDKTIGDDTNLLFDRLRTFR